MTKLYNLQQRNNKKQSEKYCAEICFIYCNNYVIIITIEVIEIIFNTALLHIRLELLLNETILMCN